MHKYVLWISRGLIGVALLVILAIVFDDPTKLPEMIPFGIGISLLCFIDELLHSKKGAKIRIAIGNTTIGKIEDKHNIFTLTIVIISLAIIFLKYVLKLF